MPVEIRELVIRAEVQSPLRDGRGNPQIQNGASSPLEKDLNDEIIQQIMDNLKRQKER